MLHAVFVCFFTSGGKKLKFYNYIRQTGEFEMFFDHESRSKSSSRSMIFTVHLSLVVLGVGMVN